MREILFKAKRIDNGKWVEGYYVKTAEASYIVVPYKTVSICGEGSIVEINGNTLCQYTGLTDKNGNEIWENDIVGEYSEYREEWYFAKVTYGHFNCSCCDGVYGWTFENGDIRCHKSYEVKGNIFDNPKLIGG